jgi:RNA polymerase sigma-32 factor
MDVLPQKEERIDKTLAKRELQALVNKKLKEFKKTLKNKELYLYEHRLLAENPATLQEIGDNYGITRERARQIEEKLLRKIKTYLEQEIPGVEDYPIKIGT